MDPIKKAVWCIESRFASDLSLDEIAEVSGVSRFHLSRAFGAATGRSVMRYVRERRLSEAARQLASGAPDILSVALDWGYGSHEAFTRAFRDQFGLTPEDLRAKGDLSSLRLAEPIAMYSDMPITLPEPRFVTEKPLLIAGFGGSFSYENTAGIPALWQRIAPHLGHIPGQIGHVCYGVSYNCDDHGQFDYIAGAAVSDFSELPAEFDRTRVPEQNYAVFEHRGHVTQIKRTYEAIWQDWLPKSGRKPADGPTLERMDERFDGATGNGVLEIWLALKG
ncbi:AraC family transcriptional regulator [Bosea vaviloviae]|uniref:AraC family transcriptional regulator n=1 Tax=Bosea vaviloviae TaxID=1526658 RepID=A0A1D7U4X7_9HYPH|nr:AraC family transcriptional regulator [Bosea vaviloviae]AOO82428.1 AraC family transcriptional regulator [Bosea vaviloviae]